ncbi:MAG: Panacea domain-containing protein [Bacteroidota bacterium]
MLGFNYKKSVQALNFFAIKEGGSINKMKALKLIWLSDRLHLRKYARPILNDTYFALNYGPVASNTKDLVEDTNFLSEEERAYRQQYLSSEEKYTYSSKHGFSGKVFSKTDIKVMGVIYEEYGKLDKFKLSEESHKYPEWKKFEGHLNSRNTSRFEMNYEDFFSISNADKNTVFESNIESLELTRDLFIENGYIYRLI